jgi:hypothetical protein
LFIFRQTDDFQNVDFLGAQPLDAAFGESSSNSRPPPKRSVVKRQAIGQSANKELTQDTPLSFPANVLPSNLLLKTVAHGYSEDRNGGYGQYIALH